MDRLPERKFKRHPRREQPLSLETIDYIVRLREETRRMREMSKPLLVALVLGVIVGLALALLGLALAMNGHADAKILFTFFGQSVDTTSVGFACIVVGGTVAYLTIRRVLKSLDILLRK